MKNLFNYGFLTGILFGLIACAVPADSNSGVELTHQPEKNRVHVTVDGKQFTNYIYNRSYKKHLRPVLYPVHGPDGVRMVRHYPIRKGVSGESKDHDHHTSLWYAHGKINGHSYWQDPRFKVEHEKFLKIDGRQIKTRNTWHGPPGVDCHDTRTLTFRTVPGGRAIDYVITLHADEGPLKIGDTKEGTMGIRTHPNLRIDRGAHAVNSNGTTGKPIWGESAKWVHYSDRIDGTNVGVALFDHPSNPRYPTTWHARHYGLITANPFGYSFFKGEGHNGSMTVEAGDSVTFRYRFLFIRGDHDAANIPERFEQWTNVSFSADAGSENGN